MRRRLTFVAVLVTLGTLVGLGAAELVIRYAERQVHPGRAQGRWIWRPDPDLLYSYVPNAVARTHFPDFGIHELKTNSLGLVSPKVGPKQSGEFRVIILGDSYTVEAVPHHSLLYAERLELEMLPNSSTRTFRVINAAVQSYSPILEYLWLKRTGLSLAPDLVILALTPNDVSDDFYFRNLLAFDPTTGLPIGSRTQWQRISAFLRRHLHSVGFLADRYSYAKAQLRHRWQVKKQAVTPATTASYLGHPLGDTYATLRRTYSDLTQQGWRDTLRYVAGIRELARGAGARFVLLSLPIREEIGEDGSYDGWKDLVDGNIDSSNLQVTLREFCRAEQIPCLDARPALREAKRTNPDRRLYQFFDYHMNEHGHAVVAHVLRDFLVQSGVLQR